jgi:ammonium transporter, Amt family
MNQQITSGCAVISEWSAVFIGIVAGWLYMAGSKLLIRLKLDDAVDAIPVHLFGGCWGVLATGLFAQPDRVMAAYDTDKHVGWFYTPFDPTLLSAQIVGALFILAWTIGTMFPFFLALNYFQLFRVHELEELAGLDASYHGSSPFSKTDETSETEEEERLIAYKQRFAERQQQRKLHRKGLDEVMNTSWAGVDLDGKMSDRGSDQSSDDPVNNRVDDSPKIVKIKRKKSADHQDAENLGSFEL